jgi:hypothetical protein
MLNIEIPNELTNQSSICIRLIRGLEIELQLWIKFWLLYTFTSNSIPSIPNNINTIPPIVLSFPIAFLNLSFPNIL